MIGIWRTLGIERTADVSAIRRAYADALRAMDPDADPEGFARLRDARDQALAIARSAPDEAEDVEDEDFDEVDPVEARPPAPPVSDLDATALHAPVLPTATPGTIAQPVEPAPFRPVTDAQADRGTGVPLPLPDHHYGAPVLNAGHGDVGVIAPPSTTPYDDAYAQVLHLLFGQEEEAPLSPDQVDRLRDRVAFLLADPRMGQIAFGQDAERWFADVLADGIPRADPVLATVAEHFGWTQRIDTLDLPYAAERVAVRARSLAFVETAQSPTDPDHKLWAELARPGDSKSRRSWFIRRGRMQTYLTKLRSRYPDAEKFLDPYRIALWDRPQVKGPNVWFWIVGVVFVVRLIAGLGHIGDPDPPKTVPAPVLIQSDRLQDRAANIDLALLSFADGFTEARVRAENPGLAKAMEERWFKAAAVRLPMDDFIRETARFLSERANAALRTARYADVTALRRIDLMDLRAAKAMGADACARWLSGDLPVREVRTQEVDQRRRRLLAAILLSGDVNETDRPRTFSVSGPVLERLKRQTGLSSAQLSEALNTKGPAAAQCATREALLEAALALPHNQALPLLRGM